MDFWEQLEQKIQNWGGGAKGSFGLSLEIHPLWRARTSQKAPLCGANNKVECLYLHRATTIALEHDQCNLGQCNALQCNIQRIIPTTKQTIQYIVYIVHSTSKVAI